MSFCKVGVVILNTVDSLGRTVYWTSPLGSLLNISNLTCSNLSLRYSSAPQAIPPSSGYQFPCWEVHGKIIAEPDGGCKVIKGPYVLDPHGWGKSPLDVLTAIPLTTASPMPSTEKAYHCAHCKAQMLNGILSITAKQEGLIGNWEAMNCLSDRSH